MYWFTGRILQEFKDLFITRMNLYFIGGLFILHGEMTIGSLLVFMKYYEMMFTQLGAINELDMQFTGDLPGLEKIKEMIGDANDQPADVNVPLTAILSGDCALSVDDISFEYGLGGKPVLQQISFEIQAGENCDCRQKRFRQKHAGEAAVRGLSATYRKDKARRSRTSSH